MDRKNPVKLFMFHSTHDLIFKQLSELDTVHLFLAAYNLSS